MRTSKQKLQLEQLDKKFRIILSLGDINPPGKGWVNNLRSLLNISLRQIAAKLNISIQSVKETEDREIAGTITLQNLNQIAEAMNMKLFYMLIPQDGSLNALIEKKANEHAREIVKRTDQSMKLEDQAVSNERIKKAIQDKVEELKREMPRYLWD